MSIDTTEEWKSVEGYEGEYLVSSMGRARSLKYGKDRVLKPYPNREGALLIGLSKNKIRIRCYVSRLIAQAFFPNWNPSFTVDHINGNRRDNRVINLRMLSHADNTRAFHKSRGGTSRYRGVGWHKSTSKWAAYIGNNGSTKHIGLFETESAAAQAYNEKAAELGYLPEALNVIKEKD